MLRILAPKRLGHLIMANGRAEALDKTLRALKYHRPEGQTVLSLGPVAAGMTTAASRSVSTPADDPSNWFGWPTLPDPSVDHRATLAALRRELTTRPAGSVLAVITEPVFEATGRAVDPELWGALAALLEEHDVPLMLSENTTAGFRSGRGMWRADTLPVQTSAVLWSPGGQLGLGFVSDRYHVPEKLTLISTWSGDEVSLTRLMWELRVVRHLPVAARGEALAMALAPLGQVTGEGLFRGVRTGQAARLRARLAERGVWAGLCAPEILRFAPPLNLTPSEIERVAEAVREVLS